MDTKELFPPTPTDIVTGGREAHPKRWYVAQVRSCCERRVAQLVAALGVEAFVPVQKEIHHWSDRRKIVERVVIPMVVFVRMPEEMIPAVRELSFVYSLLCAPGEHRPTAVPDSQMERFKAMLQQAENAVTFDPSQYIHKGTPVRVVGGSLRGLEGIVVFEPGNEATLYVEVKMLGYARVSINRELVALQEIPQTESTPTKST